MPVVALGFAVAPVAGQNFGARQPRAREGDVPDGARCMAAAAMVVFGDRLSTSRRPRWSRVFSKDPAVIAVGDEYLRIVSWNFVASGVIFVASSMFQAMGNTMPSLIASFSAHR